MNDTEQYILSSIRLHVWSGFYDVTDLHQLVDDILEGDADEQKMRAAIELEFARKVAAHSTWPDETDCDRFDALNANGIVALQNAGYTMSDGFSDIREELHHRDVQAFHGCCFYRLPTSTTMRTAHFKSENK